MNLETFENLKLELRRGCLVLAVLAVIISIFLVIDAHRNKKKRPRHRWK